MLELRNFQLFGQGFQLKSQALPEFIQVPVTASTKADPQDRMGPAPVPLRFRTVQVEAFKQLTSPREGLLHGVQKKALAEAAGAGKEIRLPLAGHPGDKGRFIDVDIALGADRLETLDADGQLRGLHAVILGLCPQGVNVKDASAGIVPLKSRATLPLRFLRPSS